MLKVASVLVVVSAVRFEKRVRSGIVKSEGPDLKGYFMRIAAKAGKVDDLRKRMLQAARIVREKEDSGTKLWFGLQEPDAISGNFAASLTFRYPPAQKVHMDGPVPKVLEFERDAKGKKLIDGDLKKSAHDLTVLAESTPKNLLNVGSCANGKNGTERGFACQMEFNNIVASKAEALSQIIKDGGNLVDTKEPNTLYWRGSKKDATTFEIFSVFENMDFLRVHLEKEDSIMARLNAVAVDFGLKQVGDNLKLKCSTVYNVVANRVTAGKRAYWAPMKANAGQEGNLQSFLKEASEIVTKNEPGTTVWFGLRGKTDTSEFVISDSFASVEDQQFHLGLSAAGPRAKKAGGVPIALQEKNRDVTMIGGIKSGLVDKIHDLNMVAEVPARDISQNGVAFNIEFTVAAGQAENLESFLKNAARDVKDEKETKYWRATRRDGNQFELFGVFNNEAGFEAHKNGAFYKTLKKITDMNGLVAGGFENGVAANLKLYSVVAMRKPAIEEDERDERREDRDEGAADGTTPAADGTTTPSADGTTTPAADGTTTPAGAAAKAGAKGKATPNAKSSEDAKSACSGDTEEKGEEKKGEEK